MTGARRSARTVATAVKAANESKPTVSKVKKAKKSSIISEVGTKRSITPTKKGKAKSKAEALVATNGADSATSTKKRASTAKSSNSKNPSKVTMHASHWKKSKKMDSEKFEKVSKAILQVLSKAKGNEGMRWGALSKEVASIVTDFEGSVEWHAISAIRELETRGQVKRDQSGKTSLYSIVR